MTVGAIILAAGEGSRLGGRAKALLNHQGRPLLDTVVNALLGGGCNEIVVVVGAYGDAVRAACPPTVSIVQNPDWPVGMSTSLKCGMEAVGDHPIIAVSVVDIPGITPALVRHLTDMHNPKTVTVPTFGGLPGHPVLFDRELAVKAADAATGDEGARAFIKRHPKKVRYWDCSHLGDRSDVDTASDLWRLE